MKAALLLGVGVGLAAAALAASTPGSAGLADTPTGTLAYETSACTYDDPGETCTNSLWVVDVRTRRSRLVARGASNAAWSRDGQRLAFIGPDYAIWTARADGSRARRIGRKYDACCSAPTWSPDGRRLAYGGGKDDNELVVVNADGTGRRVLTEMPAGVDEPAWSPDGTQIAYLTHGFGKPAIHLIGADGTGRRRLSAAQDGPAWSADGRRLLFFADVPGGSYDVFTIASDGSDRRRLTTSPDLDRHPVWSPDDRRIAFVSRRRGVTFRLYVMNADGSGQRRLTRDTGAGDDSNWSEDDPAWSPDARWVAYELGSGRDARDGIYVVHISGAPQIRVAPTTCACEGPLWRPTLGQK